MRLQPSLDHTLHTDRVGGFRGLACVRRGGLSPSGITELLHRNSGRRENAKLRSPGKPATGEPLSTQVPCVTPGVSGSPISPDAP